MKFFLKPAQKNGLRQLTAPRLSRFRVIRTEIMVRIRFGDFLEKFLDGKTSEDEIPSIDTLSVGSADSAKATAGIVLSIFA